MLLDRCLPCPVLSCLSVTLVYCDQMVGWIKMKLGTQVGLGPGHIVLDGDPASLPPKGHSPRHQFLPHTCCGQMAGWIKMPLGTKVGLGPSDIVLDGDPASSPKMGHAPPQFTVHVYCGCIRIPLGMEVGLSLGDIPLDGGQAFPPLKGHTLQFSAHVRCGQTAGWTKWFGGRPRPRRLCVRWGPSSPQKKRAQPPPNF